MTTTRTAALTTAAESFLVARIGEDLRGAAQLAMDDAASATRLAAEAQTKATLLAMYRCARNEVKVDETHLPAADLVGRELALREVLDLVLDVYRDHPDFTEACTGHHEPATPHLFR